MTNLQEAKLAREAEICYATLALVTDYDCWHPDHDSVTVDLIVANLMQNADDRAEDHRRSGLAADDGPHLRCKDALATAIITQTGADSEKVKNDLQTIVVRHITARKHL